MTIYFRNVCDTLYSIFEQVRRNIPSVILVYFGVVFVHFVSSNIYPSLCCSFTVWGFIMTPFMAVTPHCEGLRWLIHYTGEQIRNAWIWLGGYLIWYVTSYITPFITTFRTNTSNRNSQDNAEDILHQIQPDDVDVDVDQSNDDEGSRRRTRRGGANNN